MVEFRTNIHSFFANYEKNVHLILKYVFKRNG